MTKGIQQLTKKNMHDVSNAINILDPNKDAIDKAICGSGDGNWVKSTDSTLPAKEEAGKCSGLKNNVSAVSSFKQLSHMFSAPSSEAGKITYPEDATHKMGNHTSAKISKDVTALNREQHGVVSSAFAKAHEGV